MSISKKKGLGRGLSALFGDQKSEQKEKKLSQKSLGQLVEGGYVPPPARPVSICFGAFS